MRRKVWQGLVLVMLIAGVFAMGSTQAATPYMDPGGRFSFTVPDGFMPVTVAQQIPGSTVAAFVSQTTPGANFIVSTLDDPANSKTNVDDLIAGTIAQVAQQYPDVQFWTNGIVPAQVGGIEGRQYVFRTPVKATNTYVRGAILVTLKGTTSYTLSFSATDSEFDKMAEQCTPMLASFAFAGMQPTGAGAGAVPTGPTATPRNFAG